MRGNNNPMTSGILKLLFAMILSIMLVVTMTPAGVFATGTSADGGQGSSLQQAENQAETVAPADTDMDAGETAEPEPDLAEPDEPEAFSGEAEAGGVTVKVEAEEGAFPEDADLKVDTLSAKEDKKVSKALDKARKEDVNVADSYTFDIKVVDGEGNELQPADDKKVKVNFELDRAEDKNLSADIYHIREKEITDRKTKETKTVLKAEKLDAETDRKDSSVAAETDGFSLYTVEFTYEEMQYVMEGGSRTRLADILSAVGLKGEAQSVSVSNEDLFSASNENGEWIITSHKAFSSVEWMKTTINDVEYVITVTDDSGEVPVTSWTDLQAAINDDSIVGKTIKLESDIEANGADYLAVEGRTVIIDLNGKRIDRQRTSSGKNGHVFWITDDGDLTIKDSGSGGKITGGWANNGGAINIQEGSSCTIEGGIISGNKATDGGGVFVHEDATLKVTGGTISNNSANRGGGFVSHGAVELSNTKISGNTANEYGGGFYVAGGNVSMTGGVVSGNTSSDAGGVYNPGGSIVLDGVTINGNTSTQYGGAGVNNKKTASLKGCSISNNSAKLDGAGIYADGSTEITGCVITGNTTDKSGGAMRMYSGEATITNTQMSGNTAKEYGGAIYLNNGGKLTLSGGDIENNIAYKGGGGIWVGESGNLNVSGKASVTGNKASDIYLCSGRKLNITGSLKDGETKAKIGVYLANTYGVFTSGFSANNPGEDPYDYFTAEPGCSVVPKDDEVMVVASEWGRLQHMIDTAEEHDVINIDRDYEAAPEDKTLTIPSGKILTIDLNGHTIDRALDSYKEGGEVFNVSGELSIEDSAKDGSIKGGYGESGGIRVSSGGKLTLKGGVLKDNKAKTNGGGVLNEGTLEVKGGKIQDNTAEKSGGGIYSSGSVTTDPGTLISYNTAGESGGGIYIASGTTTVNAGSISSNSAFGTKDSKGGGIYIDENGKLELFGGSVTSNGAASEGGGIWHGAGESSASSLEAKGTPAVTGNTAVIGNNIMLREKKVISVVDKLEISGGTQPSAILDVTTDRIDGALTSGLTATGSDADAPRIFTYNGKSYGETLEIRQDGEIYHKDVSADVTVDSWEALQAAINASENQGKTIGLADDITASSDNDRLLLEGKNVTIDLNGHVLDRHRDSSGSNGHVFELQNGSELTIRDTVGSGVIKGGYATHGGGIHVGEGCTCTIEGGIIRGNKAGEDGGGIYVRGNLVMTGGTVTGNKANDTAGGIYCNDTGTFSISNAIISENVADNDGGGLIVHLDSNASIENSRIINNKSNTEDGGAFRMEADEKTLNIKNTVISGNQVENNGGAMVIYGGKVAMTGGSISDNTAEDGGGVFNDDGTIEFNNVRINNNKSTEESGGGVNNQHHATLRNCLIKDNRSSDAGGGVYNKSDLTLEGCTFEGNRANSKGGGVFNKEDATITNCSFDSNSASKLGGGIYLSNDTTLTNVAMKNNKADENGGAIYVDDKLKIDGGVITENDAKGGGSGIYADDTVSMKGAVIVKNNVSDDVYLEDEILDIYGALTDGDKDASVGVSLKDETGTFTKHFKDNNPDRDPADFFTADDGFSVIRDGDGEGKIVESEWPQLQKLINDNAKDISGGGEAPVLKINKDWTAKSSDKMLTIPEGKSLIIDLNGHTINRNRSSEDTNGHTFKVCSGSSLTIRDSSAGRTGMITGGWGTKGGGIYIDAGGACTIESGTISGNKAQYGGGVFVQEGSMLTFTGGTIIGNEAKSGGGIFLTDENAGSSEATVSGGAITCNNATVEGGGIWVGNNCKLNLSGKPYIKENNGSVGKNILLNPDNVINITGELIGGSGSDGARVDVAAKSGAGTESGTKLTNGLTSSSSAGSAQDIFTYNERSYDSALTIGDDGELYFRPITADLWVSDWRALQNAVADGANEGKTIGLSNDIDAAGEDYSIKVDGDDIESITIELNGCRMDRKRGSKDDDGHVINVKDGATLTIKDSAGTGVITGGKADGDGGGIKIEKDSTCIIQSGTVSGNNADTDGGGIFVKGKLVMTGGCIADNEAEDTGGGIYCQDNGTFELSNVLISGNVAENDGGGLIVHLAGDASIENCRIINNKSKTEDGGALRMEAKNRTLKITDTEISGNQTENDGGAMVIYDGRIVMTGGSVSGNRSEDGGGVYNDGGTIDFTGVTVSGNITTKYGGAGVNNKNNATLTDCDITGNIARASGGGIYTNEPMTISGGRISENSAEGQGGGIKIQDDHTTITGTEFSGNKADDDGGGIYTEEDSELTLNNCTLTSNKTKKSGGAIRIYDSTVTVSNTTMSENDAEESGGGIYINNDAKLTLDGGTITGNSSGVNGSGLCVRDETDEVCISGPVGIYENDGTSDVYLDKGKKLTVKGPLTDGVNSANIGISTRDGLDKAFTSGYGEHNKQGDTVIDPAGFFASDEDYEVYLKDGSEAALRETQIVDDPRPFIEKSSQMRRDWNMLNGKNWMSGISGERYLNEINMPGSHDSCTQRMAGNVSTSEATKYAEIAGAVLNLDFLFEIIYGKSLAEFVADYMKRFSITQIRSVEEQLEEGIRSLDLRVNTYYSKEGYPVNRKDDGKNLWVLHGKDKKAGSFFAKKSNGDFINLKDVFTWCETFLEKNPTETIIVDVAIQGIDVDEKKALERLNQHIRALSQEINPSTKESFLYTEDGDYTKVFTHYPKLKDIRGKIVLMGDTVGNGSGGLVKGVGLSNVYGPEGDYHDNSKEKIKHLTDFYSRYGFDPLPTDANNGEMALDYYYSVGTNCTDDRSLPKVTPLQYASEVLPFLFDEGGMLTDRQSQYLGLVNMDAANAKNNRQVWTTNFGNLEYCTVTAKSGESDPKPKTYTVLKNTPITIPECIYDDPNEDGQLFQYWKATKGTDAIGGGAPAGGLVGAYHPGDSFTVTEDVTFTAVWEPDGNTCVRAEWKDGNNADGTRPDELAVTVTKAPAEGAAGPAETEQITLKAADNWRMKLDYAVSEITLTPPEGYTCEVKGTKITLSHKPEKTADVKGQIEWRDNDDEKGKRPESVTLNLYKNEERIKEITVTAEDDWKYDLGTVDIYDDDINRIEYYLTEEDIEDYAEYVSGLGSEGFTVVNTLELSDSKIGGLMVWADNDNEGNTRPAKVTVRLNLNGIEVATQEVSENDDGFWTFSFDMNEDYSISEYSVTVDTIEGYISEVYMGEETGNVVYIHNLLDDHQHVAKEITRITKEATCEEDGEQTVYEICGTCGKMLSVDVQKIEALGHDWGEWKTVQSPTETETGLQTRECKRDPNHTQKRIVPASGHVHQLTIVQEKAATCTESGNIEYYKCTGGDDPCGMTFRDAEGEEWISQEETVIKPLDHDWGEWVVTREATETENGEETRTCKRNAEHKETRQIPKTVHIHNPVKVEAKAPDCMEDGNIAYYYCEGCGWYFKDGAHPGTTWMAHGEEVIPALGHDWGRWKVVEEPTETEPGLEKRTCDRNKKHIEERMIPPTGHVHDPVKVEAKEPTCTEDGNIAYYYCEGCGWYFKDGAHPGTTWIAHGEEVIPALGHDWGQVNYDWTEDCSSVTAKRSCTRCDMGESETATEENGKITSEVTKEAKCTEPGETTYTAVFDNKVFGTDSKTIADIRPTGHDWGEWEWIEGTVYEQRVCRNDPSHVQKRHADTGYIKHFAAREATCTGKGTYEYWKYMTYPWYPYQLEVYYMRAGEGDKVRRTLPDGTKLKIVNKNDIIAPPLGHDWGPWTKLDDKKHQRVCKRDEAHKQTGKHKWDKGVVTKKPTTKTKGLKTYTCKVCRGTKTETIPKEHMGRDGTALGPGASASVADRAIKALKSEKDPKGSRYLPLKLRSTKQTKKSVTIRWSRQKKAVKYVIYGSKCGKKNKIKKIFTVKTGSKVIRKVAGKKVKKGTYYRFIIVALNKNNRVVSTSKMIHVASKGGKAGNCRKVTTRAKKSKVTVRKGKTFRLAAKTVPALKKKMKKHRAIAYESSNAKIATVTKKGVIKGRKKGKCYVYAYAQNGIAAKIRVTVK